MSLCGYIKNYSLEIKKNDMNNMHKIEKGMVLAQYEEGKSTNHATQLIPSCEQSAIERHCAVVARGSRSEQAWALLRHRP